MDRRGFFRSMLGKGLSHSARRVDAVVIPFERAARAARDAMPHEHEPPETEPRGEPPLDLGLDDPDDLDTPATPLPLPATGVSDPVADEDLMRLAADAGLITRVEQVLALARRSVRLVPGADLAAPGSRTRLGGAPDLPTGAIWPTWDLEPLTFLAQIDLSETSGLGLEPLLPRAGVLLVFSALERTPSGGSPLDRDSTRVLYVEPGRLPAQPPDPEGPAQPYEARTLGLSCELVLPRVWSDAVRVLELSEDEQEAWEQVRRELAELQGVEAWTAGEPLRSRHHLLGFADESRADMQLACELVARGVDVGYAAPAAHPDAPSAEEATARWRPLLQLSVEEEAGWEFGRGRERLYVWAPDDELQEAVFAHVHALAR